MPAVSFDDDPLFEAYEICNKPADLPLASELQPAELGKLGSSLEKYLFKCT